MAIATLPHKSVQSPQNSVVPFPQRTTTIQTNEQAKTRQKIFHDNIYIFPDLSSSIAPSFQMEVTKRGGIIEQWLKEAEEEETAKDRALQEQFDSLAERIAQLEAGAG
jgi:hypothetical protein